MKLEVTWPSEEMKNLGENVDLERVCSHLSRAIQCKTISYVNSNDVDWYEFDKFHAFLEEAYPLVHQHLTLDHVGRAGLVYYWEGKNPKLNPVGFLGHQDVVPIEEGTADEWEHQPFDGYNDGKYIWGRGALDMKDHLICVMEAVESLLEDGYQPERGIYLLFGYNEEIVASEDNAAAQITEFLKKKGVRLDSTVDEGGAMIPLNYKPFINAALAGIGIGEKGYADIKVTVRGKGGHTSAPPDHTALGKLAKKIANMEAHQFPAKMPDYFADLLQSVGSALPFPLSVILKTLLCFKKPLTALLCKIPAAASFVRSCFAVTMCNASHVANQLPQKASCTINFRMLPGLTIDDCCKYIKKYMGKDVEIKVLKGKEASLVSPQDSRAFKALGAITKKMTPNAIVAPYMVMGGTDTYNYEPICNNLYRFAPFAISAGLLMTTHGTNERIPVEQLGNGVGFFKAYMKEITKD